MIQNPVILFDGVYNLCTGSVRWIIRRVLLNGPGKNGEYACVVVFREAWTPRDLGQLEPSQTTPARLEDLGEGVYRVRWGTAPSGPYVIIDTKKELIVEDSNKANQKNQPFNRPPN